MKEKALQEVLEWLNHEIKSIKKEIDTRSETIDTLQRLSDELIDYDKQSDYKDKYENLALEHEKEKERLIKLHNHYRSIETDYQNLQKKIKGWENWFYSNKDIFDRLFSSAPPVDILEQEEILPKNNKKIKRKKRK